MSQPTEQAAVATLAGAATVPELLRTTCRQLTELLDAEACALSRVIGETLVELFDYTRTGQRAQLGHGYLVPDYPLTQEVIERGESRFVSLLDDDADEREAEVLRELGFEAVLLLPLLYARGACWGLVEVYASGGRRFRQDEVELGERVVAAAGEHLQRLEAGWPGGTGAPGVESGLGSGKTDLA